jgi:SAM-dependent methyltransferase
VRTASWEPDERRAPCAPPSCRSEHATRVVATDIHPRAIELARFNAALNGITNIELRVGDLFDPVAGDAFDLIVSQPPFISRPPGARALAWLYGGERGDELPRRLLSAVLPHLREGGRAVILVDWPEVEGETVQQRVVAALGAQADGARVLLLGAERTNVDEHCTAYAFGLRREPSPDFAPLAMAWRDHFDRLGVLALRLTLNVIERGRPAWISSVDIRPLHEGQLGAHGIDRIIASRNLLAAGRDAILASTVRVAPGAMFLEVASGRVRVTFPEVLEPVEISKAAAAVIARAQEGPNVRDAIDALAPSFGEPLPQAVEKLLDGMRQAISFGILVPAGEPA